MHAPTKRKRLEGGGAGGGGVGGGGGGGGGGRVGGKGWPLSAGGANGRSWGRIGARAPARAPISPPLACTARNAVKISAGGRSCLSCGKPGQRILFRTGSLGRSPDVVASVWRASST